MSDEHPLVTRVYAPTTETARATNCPAATINRATDPLVALAAEAYYGDVDRLHGDKMANQTVLREQPIHRLMIYMHAQGASVKEIAKHTEFQPATVSKILRQPWARQRLLQILKESGQDAVKHFLTHEVAPSLELLREIRDGELSNVRPSDRAAAANSILDRALGKPTVHVESDNTNRSVPADLQRIEAEIETVRKQLADRGQSN